MRWPSAGRVLVVVSAVPALALSGWLLAGLPLVLAGWFAPLPMVLLGGALIALLCWYGLRGLPATIQATATQVSAVIGVAAASGVFNAILHSEQLIVRRDPASYAQYAIWLAEHRTVPIPKDLAAFGGADPALRFDSMGFYDYQGAIVPQFMPGAPMVDAAGVWLGGVDGLLLTPAFLGALAVLTFAGVTARLVGARWAAPAALALAVCLPILYTSRTTFSEIPSLILLFGGLAVLLDARARLRAGGLGSEGRGNRWNGASISAFLAGLVFGLALLIRIDGLRDVLPVIAYGGLLVALGRTSPRPSEKRDVPHGNSDGGPHGGSVAGWVEGRLGRPLLLGLLLGGACGFLACYALARPYLDYLSGSLKPLLALAAAVLVLTLGLAAAPRLRLPTRLPGRLPDVAAALTVLTVVLLAVRPLLETVRRVPETPEDELTMSFIRRAQEAAGLPIDGTRLYYEISLNWVIWYIGVPALILATLAAAIHVRRLGQGRDFGWLLPLAIIAWTTITTLYRPAITPDHPFASRRLVPIVLPGLILLAVWGLKWIRRRARRWAYGPRVVVVAGALLIVVPGAVTSIGTAFTPVERGESAAVSRLCEAIPANATVLIVERVTGDRMTQLVRGQCGVPAARVRAPDGAQIPLESDVRHLIARARSTGRPVVLLAAESRQVAPYGAPVHAMSLRTRQDERSLISAPDGTFSLTIDVWLATV